jgi:hypothetical protein
MQGTFTSSHNRTAFKLVLHLTVDYRLIGLRGLEETVNIPTGGIPGLLKGFGTLAARMSLSSSLRATLLDALALALFC